MLLLENAAFAPYRSEVWTAAAADLAAKESPAAIFAPVTSRQREFVARLAAKLGVGLSADSVRLAMEGDKPDRPNATDAPRVVREIRFENVEFAYREGRPVVRDFDVVVPGGSVVALVGRSGAGKTTVTDLVARFHDTTRGRILVNGTDIRDYRLRTYRDLLALVQQEVFLFDGSVRDN